MAFTTQMTRTLNKEFKDLLPLGLRVQAGTAGSFLSVRIEDPDGLISIKLLDQIAQRANIIWGDMGVKTDWPVLSYHMGGSLINWGIK